MWMVIPDCLQFKKDFLSIRFIRCQQEHEYDHRNISSVFADVAVKVSLAALYHSWSNALTLNLIATAKNSTLTPVPGCALIAAGQKRQLDAYYHMFLVRTANRTPTKDFVLSKI